MGFVPALLKHKLYHKIFTPWLKTPLKMINWWSRDSLTNPKLFFLLPSFFDFCQKISYIQNLDQFWIFWQTWVSWATTSTFTAGDHLLLSPLYSALLAPPRHRTWPTFEQHFLCPLLSLLHLLQVDRGWPSSQHDFLCCSQELAKICQLSEQTCCGDQSDISQDTLQPELEGVHAGSTVQAKIK